MKIEYIKELKQVQQEPHALTNKLCEWLLAGKITCAEIIAVSLHAQDFFKLTPDHVENIAYKCFIYNPMLSFHLRNENFKNHNHLPSCLNIGISHLYGNGTKKDIYSARKYLFFYYVFSRGPYDSSSHPFLGKDNFGYVYQFVYISLANATLNEVAASFCEEHIKNYNFPITSYQHGVNYLYGMNCMKNHDMAVEFLTAAYERHGVACRYELGLAYYNKNDFNLAFYFLREFVYKNEVKETLKQQGHDKYQRFCIYYYGQLKQKYQLKVDAIIAFEEKSNSYTRGKVFTDNFTLLYPTKRPDKRKQCVILDARVNRNLTVHDRQAIHESFLLHTNNSHEVIRELSFSTNRERTTYVLAHIGCVISNASHGNHNGRVFITAPILVRSNDFFRASKHREEKWLNDTHAEENFEEHINDYDNLKEAFINLFNINNVTDYSSRKIYTIVFDLHGSQDMCDGIGRCEGRLFSMQEKNGDFYTMARRILEGYVDNNQRPILGLVAKLPKPASNNFKIVIRYSSVRNSSFTPVQFMEREITGREFARDTPYSIPVDIKKSDHVLILHSNNKMKMNLQRWYDNRSYDEHEEVVIPKETVFYNKNGYQPQCKIPEPLQSKIKMPN